MIDACRIVVETVTIITAVLLSISLFYLYNRMRGLFTDGYNSMWHFIFGASSFYFTPITIIFVSYQFLVHFNSNTWIDLLEFVLGFLTVTLLSKASDIVLYHQDWQQHNES